MAHQQSLLVIFVLCGICTMWPSREKCVLGQWLKVVYLISSYRSTRLIANRQQIFKEFDRSVTNYCNCVCKCFAVVPESNVTSVRFDVAARSRDSAPWRMELVFESASPSPRAGVHRGRAKVDVCRQKGDRERCRQWKPVRYRQYVGLRRRYSVYDVTAAVAPSLMFCYSKPCRFIVSHCTSLINARQKTDKLVQNSVCLCVWYRPILCYVRIQSLPVCLIILLLQTELCCKIRTASPLLGFGGGG